MSPPIAIVSPSRKTTVVSALRVLTVGGKFGLLDAAPGVLTSGFTFSVMRRSALTVGFTTSLTPALIN